VKDFAPGDLVMVPFQISCGDCERCRRGHTNACTSVPFRSSYGLKPVCGVEYGSALSDLIRIPFADHMLIRQPEGHALSQTAGLVDGATDAFSAVAYWMRQQPGAEVPVIGGLGQSLSMFAVQAALGRSWSMPRRPTPVLLAFRSTEPNGCCQRMYGDFAETTPVPLRYIYGVGITLRVSRVNVRAEMPDCVAHVAAGHFHPEHVITRRVRFEDAHEAIGDPTIRVAFVRDGIE